MQLTTQDKKDIAQKIEEIVNSMTRVDAERTLQKEFIAGLKDKYEVSPKAIRQVAKLRNNNKKEEAEHESDELYSFYDEIFTA